MKIINSYYISSIFCLSLLIGFNSIAFGQSQEVSVSDCHGSMYGCCPDGISPADGPNLENCQMNSIENEESCELTEYGCCSDDYTAAKGPYKEGCIDYSCRDSEYGCCDDLVTSAKNEDLTNCPTDCFYSPYGCCSDGKTASRGPGQAGCPSSRNQSNSENCSDSQYGCCPDGVTIAQTSNKENCQAITSTFSNTPSTSFIITSKHPEKVEAADDFKKQSIESEQLQKQIKIKNLRLDSSLNSCANSLYECCPDGIQAATGHGFQGCKEQSAYSNSKALIKDENTCLLPEPEKNCYNYTLQWRYDAKEGRCVQFWYGGCDGNANLFNSNEECEGKCIKPNGTNVCKLPLVNSFTQCQNNVTRYYYDFKSSSCKRFTYSGCFGNANNFETLDECERKCQVLLLFEQCSFIPDKGPCLGNYERWYFDSKVGSCKTFQYGGCIRNKNNHLSESDCIDSCVKPKQKSVCLLPKIVGNCDQKINQWYYDFNDGKCKILVYSGCNGNLNRFESLEACEYTCQGLYEQSKQTSIVEELCNAPKSSGACNLDLQRWYFNKTTLMCHQFTYTGCDGNSNNFESEADCRNTCNAKETDPCVLPLDHGTCDRYKIYWYFNQVDRECVRFYYGGCDGNQNRFENRESCEISCKMSKEEKELMLKLPKQCISPLEYGSNCDPITPKWYFDLQSKSCYPFEYSGCGPEKGNRFLTNEECNRICVDSLNKTSLIKIVPIDVENIDNSLNLENNSISSGIITTAMTALKQSSVPSESSKVHIDLCDLPMVKGNCSQKAIKWFFDRKSKYCRQFEFSGCNGNENRFETRHQCTEICEIPKKREICNSNKVQGPCVDFKKRWYLDTETRSCKEFRYGGCLGNENNFESKIDCRNFCWEYLNDEAKASTDNLYENGNGVNKTEEIQTEMDVCNLNKDEGKCHNSTERWYFDQSIRECRKFVYKGCNGNGNNFETREKCEVKCSHNLISVLDTSVINYESPCESPNDILQDCINEQTNDILPAKLNRNLNNLIWFYDIETRSCRHIAHDCIRSMNPNRFSSYELCKTQCAPNVDEKQTQNDCLLPMDVGEKCNLQMWRWYYDSAAGECYLFSYSGCHGNNNNFPTSKSCLWLCASIGNHGCPSLENCKETCKYGRVKSLNNCELCECNNPCENVKCPFNEECVVADDQTTFCKSQNKPGLCPKKTIIANLSCNKTCIRDADCPVDQKCCPNSCSGMHCVSASFDQDPEIIEFVSRTELIEGDRLVLPCKVTGYPTPNVTWYKNHHEITFNPTDSRVLFSHENNSLIITNVNDKDEAIYSCRASSKSGKAVVKESNVYINVPPTYKTNSYDKYELFGSDAIINCNIFGRPYPKFEWRLNSTQIKANPFKYTLFSNILIVKRFDLNDVGKYICTGSNGIGKPASIAVNLKRAIPGEVKFNFMQVDGLVNRSIVLTCNSTGSPKPNITWITPQNQYISANHNSYNKSKYELINEIDLKINWIVLKDSGIYRCSAVNQFSYNFMKKKYGSIRLNFVNYVNDKKINKPPITTITSKTETVVIKHLSKLSLNCSPNEKFKNYNITWFKNGQQIKVNKNNDNQTITTNLAYQEIQNKTIYEIVNGSLIKEECKIGNDDGIYSCLIVDDENNTLVNINYTVKISKPLINQTLTLILNVSDSAKLNCNFQQDEKLLNISWKFKNIDNLRHSNDLSNYNESSILINEASLNDSGIYECSSETDSKYYHTIISLTINNRSIKYRSNHTLIKAVRDKSVVLDCSWWFNENNLQIFSENLTEWRLNDSVIDRKAIADSNGKFEFLDTYNTLLKINNLKMSEKNNLYSCIFKNNKYDIKQSNFSLFIGIAPHITKEYANYNNTVKWHDIFNTVTLDCPIEGLPKPNKSWEFNNTHITNIEENFGWILIDNGSKLQINNFNDNLQGSYVCNATNEFGSIGFKYKIQIAKPIYVIEPSKNVLTVKKSENVLIKCDYAGGRPKPITSWLFNNNLLKITEDSSKYSSDENILNIKNVTRHDSGTYTCILSNGYHKQINYNFTLNVIEQPIITFLPESPIFEIGSQGVIKCLVESSSQLVSNQISWYKNGNKLEQSEKYRINGTMLAINQIIAEDAGKYLCKVSIGTSNTKKQVNVKVIENDKDSECQDTSSYAHCKLVVTKGLCSKWGKFCCKSCKSAGNDDIRKNGIKL